MATAASPQGARVEMLTAAAAAETRALLGSQSFPSAAVLLQLSPGLLLPLNSVVSVFTDAETPGLRRQQTFAEVPEPEFKGKVDSSNISVPSWSQNFPEGASSASGGMPNDLRGT